jgi:prepilin-type N-terminal cleavage/methylation domain-containing protein
MMKLLTTAGRFTKGFTLVEMLVYLAIFTITATASVGFLLSLKDFVDQYRIETALYQSGTNALEQIVLSIRQGDEVDLLNTIVNSPATGKLTVDRGASTTSFTLTAGTLEMAVDGVNLGDMMNVPVTVSEFTVYHYPITEGEFVRVKLRLTATVDAVTKTITLYGGSVVRGAT